jgi:hypothetical protein
MLKHIGYKLQILYIGNFTLLVQVFKDKLKWETKASVCPVELAGRVAARGGGSVDAANLCTLIRARCNHGPSGAVLSRPRAGQRRDRAGTSFV